VCFGDEKQKGIYLRSECLLVLCTCGYFWMTLFQDFLCSFCWVLWSTFDISSFHKLRGNFKTQDNLLLPCPSPPPISKEPKRSCQGNIAEKRQFKGRVAFVFEFSFFWHSHFTSQITYLQQLFFFFNNWFARF
jgi:hypothetical protein